MSNLAKLLTSLTLALVLVGAVVVPVVLATEKPSVRTDQLPERSPKSSPGPNVRSCQAREGAIKTRSTSLTRKSNNMLTKFDAIAERVKDYYEDSDKTVANYATLVANMEAKKLAAQTALTAATTKVNGFNCNVPEPKKHMGEYQVEMKKVKSALQDYRTSVKNLIVAVRSTKGDDL